MRGVANRSSYNKARMISLYIQYRDGVPDEDRRRLYQHAHLSIDREAVDALELMGVRISRVRRVHHLLASAGWLICRLGG